MSALLIFSKQIVLIFSREEYLSATIIFPILVPTSFLFGIGEIFLSNLYAIGKPKTQRDIVIVTTLLFFIFSFFLIPRFSSLGIALSYFFSSLLRLLLGYFYLKKSFPLKLPLNEFFKCLVSSLLAFSLLYYLSRFTVGLMDYIFAGICGILYLIFLYIMRFYNRDDVRIVEIIQLRIPFFKPFLEQLRNFLSKRVSS